MVFLSIFFFNDTATTEIYTLSLHDALPIFIFVCPRRPAFGCERRQSRGSSSSEPQFVPGCAVHRRLPKKTPSHPPALYSRACTLYSVSASSHPEYKEIGRAHV